MIDLSGTEGRVAGGGSKFGFEGGLGFAGRKTLSGDSLDQFGLVVATSEGELEGNRNDVWFEGFAGLAPRLDKPIALVTSDSVEQVDQTISRRFETLKDKSKFEAKPILEAIEYSQL